MDMEENVLYCEDCLTTMDRILEGAVSGIITSPPYNINTERGDCYYNNGYSELDSLSEEDYLNRRTAEFHSFSKILDDRGVICYNISYSKENPILPTLLLSKVHEETDLTLADIITWKKTNAIPFQTSPTKLSRITEHIYVIVKKEHLHTFRANKEVSKVNERTGQKFYRNYTNLIEARNNDGFKSRNKATFSQELVDRLLNIYFPVGSLIYDPFIGIGTTALSCVRKDRQYIGSEIKKEFYDTAMERLSEVILDI